MLQKKKNYIRDRENSANLFCEYKTKTGYLALIFFLICLHNLFRTSFRKQVSFVFILLILLLKSVVEACGSWQSRPQKVWPQSSSPADDVADQENIQEYHCRADILPLQSQLCHVLHYLPKLANREGVSSELESNRDYLWEPQRPRQPKCSGKSQTWNSLSLNAMPLISEKTEFPRQHCLTLLWCKMAKKQLYDKYVCVRPTT